MTYGKPVIGSDAGGIVDIVRPGRNGWLTPPGDAEALAGAIRECLADPARAAEYGRNGRADVEAEFSWEAISLSLLRLYASVVTRS
jgi:glycosyltransferase involved in cell wall biosynthesis